MEITFEALDHAYARISKNKKVSSWMKSNEGSFLANAFNTAEGSQFGPWQFGFFHPSTKMMVAINATMQPSISEPSEILESGNPIRELDLSKVRIKLDDALEKAWEAGKKHPKESFIRKLVILQHSDKQHWNITLVSQSLNTLTVKVDSQSGAVLDEQFGSLISQAFGK